MVTVECIFYMYICTVVLVKICLNIMYVPTQGGWTALMWAAYKGCTDVADLLLDKGANPNITGQVLRILPLSTTIVFLIYLWR